MERGAEDAGTDVLGSRLRLVSRGFARGTCGRASRRFNDSRASEIEEGGRDAVEDVTELHREAQVVRVRDAALGTVPDAHRGADRAAQERRADLFSVLATGVALRQAERAGIRLRADLGDRRRVHLHHAAGELPDVRRARGVRAVVGREVVGDAYVHDLPGEVGEASELERSRVALRHQLAEGVRRGPLRRRIRAQTPGYGRRDGHRRRRGAVRQGAPLPDPGVPAR